MISSNNLKYLRIHHPSGPVLVGLMDFFVVCLALKKHKYVFSIKHNMKVTLLIPGTLVKEQGSLALIWYTKNPSIKA